MQSASHAGFALATSMCLNSSVYAFVPAQLPNNWEEILHAIGQPYTLAYFAAFIHHPLYLADTAILIAILHKLTFYVLLILSATVPDRWEHLNFRVQETDGEQESSLAQSGSNSLQSHRGFTHSVLIWILVVSLFGIPYMIFMRYLFVTHMVLTGLQVAAVEEGSVLFLALLLGMILHTIADMLTYRGVKVLWPDEQHYGFGPRRWRFKNESWREYAVLWGMIFLAGVLFAKGIVGF